MKNRVYESNNNEQRGCISKNCIIKMLTHFRWMFRFWFNEFYISVV